MLCVVVQDKEGSASLDMRFTWDKPPYRSNRYILVELVGFFETPRNFAYKMKAFMRALIMARYPSACDSLT